MGDAFPFETRNVEDCPYDRDHVLHDAWCDGYGAATRKAVEAAMRAYKHILKLELKLAAYEAVLGEGNGLADIWANPGKVVDWNNRETRAEWVCRAILTHLRNQVKEKMEGDDG